MKDHILIRIFISDDVTDPPWVNEPQAIPTSPDPAHLPFKFDRAQFQYHHAPWWALAQLPRLHQSLSLSLVLWNTVARFYKFVLENSSVSKFFLTNIASISSKFKLVGHSIHPWSLFISNY